MSSSKSQLHFGPVMYRLHWCDALASECTIWLWSTSRHLVSLLKKTANLIITSAVPRKDEDVEAEAALQRSNKFAKSVKQESVPLTKNARHRFRREPPRHGAGTAHHGILCRVQATPAILLGET